MYRRRSIGSFAEVKGGKRLPDGHDLVSSLTIHPYIRARDIRGGSVTFDEPCYLTEETFQQINRYTVRAGDVCVTIVGANVGDVGRVPDWLDRANLTENAAKITDLKSFDSRFLTYALLERGAQDQMKLLAGGAAQPKLGLYKIKDVEVFAPDFPAQRRIADILSAYDDLIENNTKRSKILEETARSLYREWFVNFRFPGHERVKLVNSPGGKVPEGWRRITIRDIAERVDYGYAASAQNEPVGPKFLRITDIVPESIDWDAVPYCEIDESNGKYDLLDGDIVVARTGATTGYAKRLNRRHPRAVFASYLVRVRARTSVLSHYVGILMESDDYKMFVTRNRSGSAQPQANAQVLISMELWLPPDRILERFAEISQLLRDRVELLQGQTCILRNTRDLLLPRLISGEIDVSHLEAPDT